jgi:hypothetical protein
MKSRYPYAQGVINTLTNQGWYEFTLNGQFEDVIGQYADIQWKTGRLSGKRSLFEKLASDEIFQEPPSNDDDPPKVYPTPPKVTIVTGKYNQTKIEEKVAGD